MNQQQPRQYKWGRVRGTSIPALRIAIPAGILVALAVALAVQLCLSAREELQLGSIATVVIYWACFTLPGIMLVWVLIVDRLSIPGTVLHPEESVESAWLGQAASSAFWVVVGTAGLGSAILIPLTNSLIGWTLAGVTVFALAAFTLAYCIQKLKERR